VHAIVRVRTDSGITEDDLKQHCGELIAGYKRPRSYTFAPEALPRSAAGKVLKVELRKPYWENADRKIG
jgi:long-chain acyl-CoA synthetase